MECRIKSHSLRDVPEPANSNHDPRKKQPTNKVHKKGDNQSKMA
jgi:hypothetical protein